MKRCLLLMAAWLCVVAAMAQQQDVKMLEGEKWWGCATDLGDQMPYDEHTQLHSNLWYQDYNNQTGSLLVSNKGRYIWCDDVYELDIKNGFMTFVSPGKVHCVEAGKSLREAYVAAKDAYFPSTGTIPEELFFSKPQYNTWIELARDQNQKDILKYAHSIVDNGLPKGILMIDDNWQQGYGNYDFRTDRFPDPKGMVDELHGMGFQIMLWISPFVTADSQEFKTCRDGGYLLKAKDGENINIVKWWNGYSAVLDLSNPATNDYLYKTLKHVQEKYGIDGFKFDGGDPQYYDSKTAMAYDKKSYGPHQTELWAKFAARFPYNELRASWRMGGQPVVQRLGDKAFSWHDVRKLVPTMISAGLLGHLYTCPDMIGGGSAAGFRKIYAEGKLDEKLVVRSCEIHSMMPMMQFSVAPWRILSKENFDICVKFAKLHSELGSYIVEQARKAAKSGEPIVRNMEYVYPGEGFENCLDEYMLGEKYLVAPVMDETFSRTVKLPKGKWRDEQGKTYKGGKTYTLDVPLDRLPYFVKVSK